MDNQQGQEWLDLPKEEFVRKYSLEVWEDYEALHESYIFSEEPDIEEIQ